MQHVTSQAAYITGTYLTLAYSTHTSVREEWMIVRVIVELVPQADGELLEVWK
jgi:hypothetical protein